MNTGELRRVLSHRGPFATVHLDGSHDLRDADLWTSDEPRSVAFTEEELRAVGAEHVDRVRADEALPAAALMTGAEPVSAGDVCGEPVAVRDGVGVPLRHKP